MEEDIKIEVEGAAKALRNGDIILYPTDTVWGIGCDATLDSAVERVFEIKQRSDSKSLIILVSDLDMLAKYVKEIPPMALELIEVNDRPMTIIYPQGVGLSAKVIAEDGSVAIRIPKNDFCVEMIRKFGKPVVSTSANISGDETPSCFAEINAEILDSADYVVEPCLEEDSEGRSSQIIKLGMGGEVTIIRE
ncbi:MAG: threonylcarbamoyl-AMP synthase [Bacteroidales bacterium]|nr:threonylcarbamoyl-AMP synthase [Candidatus Equibacterium intestinale]